MSRVLHNGSIFRETSPVEPILTWGNAPGTQPPFAKAEILFDEGNGSACIPRNTEVRFPPGRFLARKGRIPSHVLILADGIAGVPPTRETLILDEQQWLTADDVIGLAESVARRAFGYDVIASTYCVARAVEISDLMDHILARPERSYGVSRLLAGFISSTRKKLKGSSAPN